MASVEVHMARGLTKRRAAVRAAAMRAHASGAVEAFLAAYPAQHAPQAGEVLRDVIVGRNAVLTSPLTEACALTALAGRMCPHAPCSEDRERAEALFRGKGRAA